MNPKHTHPSRFLAGIVIGSVVLIAGLSASFAAAEPPSCHKQEWANHHQEWCKEKLDQTAERLEIKSSQQSAWQAYAKTVETLGAGSVKEPGETADAATIARFHADKAGAFAGKLKQIADATAKLQSIMTPEQRKTFDQIVRLAAPHGGSHHAPEEMMHGHEGALGHGDHEHCEHHAGNQSEAAPPPAP